MVFQNNLVDFGFSFGCEVVILYLNLCDSKVAGQRVLKCGSVALIDVVARDIKPANAFVQF